MPRQNQLPSHLHSYHHRIPFKFHFYPKISSMYSSNIYTRKFRNISTIKTKNSVIKHQIDLIRELWIENLNLDNTSGMAEAMASNVVSENQVISGRRYSIILFVNPHFFFFFWFQILCASDDRFFKDNNRGRE